MALDDDDTEGQAISVHFPSTADADKFRRRLMTAGLLTGTDAVTGKPARSGFMEGVDGGLTGGGSLGSTTNERPAGHGPLEGVTAEIPLPLGTNGQSTWAGHSPVAPASIQPR